MAVLKRLRDDLLAVTATWALLLMCMALAQALNYRLGFNVWPMGEDRNWIDILQNRNGPGAARAFWQINDRNALSPWWYIALRPIILRFDAGMLIIREFVGLLLAVSAYVFLFVMTQARTFALGVACVMAVFLGSGHIDQIYWPMQLALVFSLWSLTLYKLSAENVPADYRLYAGAIVAWFFALGTYSVQTGAILGIAFLAFTAPSATAIARGRRAMTDTLPFALIFVAFWLEWQTAARDDYAAPLHLREAILSVMQAFWHFDFLLFFDSVSYVDHSYQMVYGAISGAVAITVFCALGHRDTENPSALPSWRALLETVGVVGCLMLPVVAVDATGHGIPGVGWRKVYQFTIPFLYLSIAAALFMALPTKAARLSWRVAAASLAALAAAVTLGINRIQVDVTHNEKLLRTALIRLAQENFNEGIAPPYQFLVRREPDFLWYSSDVLSPTYARTWNFPLATSFRFLPSPDVSDPRLSMRFTEDGVENADLDEATTIGNSHVFPVSASKEGVRRLCSIGPEDVKSPVVGWRRSTVWQSKVGDCASAQGASQ